MKCTIQNNSLPTFEGYQTKDHYKCFFSFWNWRSSWNEQLLQMIFPFHKNKVSIIIFFWRETKTEESNLEQQRRWTWNSPKWNWIINKLVICLYSPPEFLVNLYPVFKIQEIVTKKLLFILYWNAISATHLKLYFSFPILQIANTKPFYNL